MYTFKVLKNVRVIMKIEQAKMTNESDNAVEKE
jgi:hypothetical protein